MSELAILVVARRWSAHYEWATHAVEAARAGLPDDVIAAIAARRTPALAEGVEQAVYDVAAELVADGVVADATFARADAAVGRQGLVELVGLVGYYTMVAMTLNAFEVPVPADAPRLPYRPSSPQRRLHPRDRQLHLSQLCEHPLGLADGLAELAGVRDRAALHFPRQVARRLGTGAADGDGLLVRFDDALHLAPLVVGHVAIVAKGRRTTSGVVSSGRVETTLEVVLRGGPVAGLTSPASFSMLGAFPRRCT